MRTLTIMVLLGMSSTAMAVPMTLNHQGRLFDPTGAPLDQSGVALKFVLYDAPSTGNTLWQDTIPVDVDNGYFSVILGSGATLDSSVFEGDTMYLGLTVGTAAELPVRLLINSVPFAIRAQTSTSVDGGVVNASEIQINGTTVIDSSGSVTGPSDWASLTGVPAGFADDTDDDTLAGLGCTTEQIALYNGSSWACADHNAHAHAASDLTSGTVDITRLPTGTTSNTVAHGDHGHDAAQVQSGTLDIARLPTGTSATDVAPGDHAHSGPVAVTRLPVGTGGSQVAAGDHAHTGPVAFSRLPAGTGGSEVALGDHTHSAAADLNVSGDLDVGGLISVGQSSLSCTASLDGTIRYDSSKKELLFCDGTDWVLFGGIPLGAAASNPAISCKAILSAGAATGDQEYWIGITSPRQVFCNMSTTTSSPDYMVITPADFYHGDDSTKYGSTNGSNVFNYGCDGCGAAQNWYQYDCPDSDWELHYYTLRSHCIHTNHTTGDSVFQIQTTSNNGVEGVQARQISDGCGDPNEFTFVGVCMRTGNTETDPGSGTWDSYMRNVAWTN